MEKTIFLVVSYCYDNFDVILFSNDGICSRRRGLDLYDAPIE